MPWITTRFYGHLLRAKHSANWQNYVYSSAGSGSISLPSLSSLAVTHTLRTTTGLLSQPSADEPSGWLVLSAIVGLPMALWAYKVRLSVRLAMWVIF
jgi:hypothetical protein